MLGAAIVCARTEHERFMRAEPTKISPRSEQSNHASKFTAVQSYPTHPSPRTAKEMQCCKRVLMSHFFFACLQERVLNILVRSVLRKIAPKVGSTLFSRTAPKAFYILVKGKIQIWNRHCSSVISDPWSTFGRWSAGDEWNGSWCSAKVTGNRQQNTTKASQARAVLFVLDRPALESLADSMTKILRVYTTRKFCGAKCWSSVVQQRMQRPNTV